MVDDGEYTFRPEVYDARPSCSRKPLPRRSLFLAIPGSKLSDLLLFPALLSYLNGCTTAFALAFSGTVSFHCGYNLALALATWALHIPTSLPGTPRMPILESKPHCTGF